MAKRPILTIDGVIYANVQSVSFEMFTPHDDTMRPTDDPHAKCITVTREMDSNSPVIADWAGQKEATGRKAGEISFRDPNDADMLTISWTEGYICSYRCELPNMTTRANEQPFETFDILYQTVSVGSTVIDNQWSS